MGYGTEGEDRKQNTRIIQGSYVEYLDIKTDMRVLKWTEKNNTNTFEVHCNFVADLEAHYGFWV